MANPSDYPPPSACPVDPSARAAWIEKSSHAPHPFLSPSTSTSTSPPASTSTDPPRVIKTRPLASDREVSSIPRAPSSPATTTPNPSSQPTSPTLQPQQQSDQAPVSNWIYPSEKMFFEALRRKNHSPLPSTVASIVPIHNAVNERAWSRILVDWEMRSPSARAANAPCGGPRLRSFSGDSGKLTPRARWYGWLGYERPFDRHDWVVERCSGESIEYVIDFYRGKGGGVSFYLDVRPKLNSWAGWKMRLGKLVGL